MSPVKSNIQAKDIGTEKLNWINQASELFIKDKKNSNCLIDILQEIESSEDAVVILQCVQSIQKIFVHLILTEYMSCKSTNNENSEKYVEWIKDRYNDVQKKLFNLLNHSKFVIQEKSLFTLMAFIAAEGEKPIQTSVENCFPFSLFLAIIKALTTCTDKRLIKKFLQEFSSYEDINFNLIKALCQTIKSQNNMKYSETFVSNAFELMSQVSLSNSEKENDHKNFCKNADVNLNYHKNYAYSCKIFSVLWMDFLKMKLTNILYKKVLIMLHSKVLPHLEKPLLLTDFLISSYDIGGSTSLLALNGLFFLIQNHNLEYPDFYNKLYSLFEPSLFHTKYCARFFHLANIFLTSTYLPIYLVAAFAKKLSRLSLTSPVTKQFIIIPFIGNLLIRHPNLLNMANRMGDIPDMTSDPYNPEEDPANCNAISSSLWEIKDLLSHWHPDISNLAKFIDKPLPNIEYDISETLEISYDELMEKEVDKMKNCPTTFIKPSGSIFSSDFNEWEL